MGHLKGINLSGKYIRGKSETLLCYRHDGQLLLRYEAPVQCQSCMGDWPKFWPPYHLVVSEPLGGLGEHMHPMVLIMFSLNYPDGHVQQARANRVGGSTTCRRRMPDS